MAQPYNKIFSEEKWALVKPENKEIIQDFVQEMKSQKKSEGTIKQYFNDLRILAIYVLDNLENKSFLELKKRDYRNFVINCDSDWNLSNARINRMLSAIRMLCNYLEEDDDEYEEYEHSAASKVKGLPKEKIREITFLPNDIIELLYQKFIAEKRYREATLLAILYDSGCRRQEIAQVLRNSITENGNATNVVTGKRGKKFKVLYFNHTKEAFKLYDATRSVDDKDPLLFPVSGITLYDWVQEWKDDLLELTGISYDNLNVHTFRHCYIQNLLDGTHWLCEELNLGAVPLEKIKSLAHHESSETTLGYTINDEQRDIEDLLGIKLN